MPSVRCVRTAWNSPSRCERRKACGVASRPWSGSGWCAGGVVSVVRHSPQPGRSSIRSLAGSSAPPCGPELDGVECGIEILARSGQSVVAARGALLNQAGCEQVGEARVKHAGGDPFAPVTQRRGPQLLASVELPQDSKDPTSSKEVERLVHRVRIGVHVWPPGRLPRQEWVRGRGGCRKSESILNPKYRFDFRTGSRNRGGYLRRHRTLEGGERSDLVGRLGGERPTQFDEPLSFTRLPSPSKTCPR